MISRTLGAPLGGTTRGAHHGFDCRAPSLITPPNFGSGGGSCLPLIDVVAPGEPDTPVICCARPEAPLRRAAARSAMTVIAVRDVLTSLPPCRRDPALRTP